MLRTAPAEAGRKAFAVFMREYEWIHRGLGILGNLCFFVGSILFLSGGAGAGWLFIAGSSGMLVDRACSTIVHFQRLRDEGKPLT